MAEFRWIHMSLCLILISQSEVIGETSKMAKVGDDVTLPCLKMIPDQKMCNGTTWTFSDSSKSTVELINLSRVKSKTDRLSLTENCSLLIKKVTDEEAGLYHCDQYRSTTGQPVHQSGIYLSVINMTEHQVDNKVTLSCSVSRFGSCHHRVTWLFMGKAVEKKGGEIQTSEGDCAATVSVQKPHFIQSKLFTCEVTDEKTENRKQFNFTSKPSGRKTDMSLPSIIVPVVLVVILIAVVLIIIRWKRAAGNNTEASGNAELSLNPAGTESVPGPSQDPAEPEVSYATISYTMNINSKTRGDGHDGDAVTYSTVKAPSSSDRAVLDPSQLYATVNHPK
ncbi:uncharacterized protein KZ484_014360 [Pholidichthys leucotaenia]